MTTELTASAGDELASAEAGALVPTPVTQAVWELVDGGPSFGDIPLDCIRVSKTNPRKIFNEDQLQELAESIKKQGVAQPILVRPIEVIEGVTYFELIAGERRFRASRLAGKLTIPAIVRVLSDEVAYELQVLENLQRVDLHPLEEAEGFEVWMKEFNVSVEQMAEKAGKSKAYMYASLKLCALVPKAREAFYAGELTKSTALYVARIPGKALQEQAVRDITNGYGGGPMSARAAFGHIERNYMLQLSKANFKPSDPTLVPAAGSCTDCPKRTGNQPEIFGDVKNAHVCTDPACYKAKGEAHVIQIRQLAKENDQQVLSGQEAKKIMPYSWSTDLKGGYVGVDLPVQADEKKRSFRKILGKELPPTTLLENPHNEGEFIHVIKLDEIKPLLEKKGHVIPKASPANSFDERQKELEKKTKLEREYRKQLLRATHDASLMMNLVDVDLRLVATQLFANLPWGTIPTKFLIELYGWTEEMFHKRGEGIRAVIDALTPAQLNQFIRDCTLCRELDVSIWAFDAKSKPEHLLAFAKRTKVDAKAIRAEVESQAASKKRKAKAQAPKASAQVADPAAVTQAEEPTAPDPVAEQTDFWPFPLDVKSMRPEDLPAFIDAKPNLINDLAAAIVRDGTDDLVTAINAAATERGYVVVNGLFQLQESKSTTAEHGEDERCYECFGTGERDGEECRFCLGTGFPRDPFSEQAESSQPFVQPPEEADAGLVDMTPAAAGAEQLKSAKAKPGTKKTAGAKKKSAANGQE